MLIRTGGLQVALRSVLAPGICFSRVLKNIPKASGIPQARPSWALAGKMLLDELFFFTEAVSAGVFSVMDRRALLMEVAAAMRFYAAQGWLEHPASFHSDPPPPRLWSVQPSRSRGPGGLDQRFDHLRFESSYTPHLGDPGRARWLTYHPNHTAHTWLLEHAGPPRPWLVCVHAYRMGFPLADFFAFPAAWFHHELGLNVAFPVLPLHGPRKVGWRTGDGIFSGHILDTIHMQAQAVWDVRRLISWLRTSAGAPKVAVYGLSLGGYTTALLAALEAELDCAVAGVPHADYLDLARWNVPKLFFRLLDHLGMPWDDLESLFRVISPLAIAPRIPRERRYLFAAMADRLVPPTHARDLWLHWECPRMTWYEGSHVSFGWEPEVRALLLEALETSGMLGYVAATEARATNGSANKGPHPPVAEGPVASPISPVAHRNGTSRSTSVPPLTGDRSLSDV